MNITRYAIEKNRVTSVLLILILLGGLQCGHTIPMLCQALFLTVPRLIMSYISVVPMPL